MPVTTQPRPLRTAPTITTDMQALAELLELLPRERGNCYGAADSQVWVSGTGPKRKAYAKLKQICTGCPIRDWCGEQGKNESEGVWGGTDPFDRGTVRDR